MHHRVLREEHVQRLWEVQPFDPLITECGRPVHVHFAGLRSGIGPDFRAARIRIGEEVRVGDVEIHLVPSGWREHRHHEDGSYEGVVLHVVLDRDPVPLPGPVVVLRSFLPRSAWDIARGEFASPPPQWPLAGGEWEQLLESAGRLRWERRRARFRAEEKRVGREEAMHRAFFTALGWRRNRGAFRELGRMVTSREVAGREEAVIRRRLRRAAEAIQLWRRAGVRPPGSPGRRIRSAASLLSRGPVSEIDSVRMLLKRSGLSRERAAVIHHHALLPGREDGLSVLARHRPLPSNAREREALRMAPPGSEKGVTNLLRQMGLLELRDGLSR